MRKLLFTLVAVILGVSSFATNYFWVGGTTPANGFSAQSNWSTTAGGSPVGGAATVIAFTNADVLTINGANVGTTGSPATGTITCPGATATFVCGQLILTNSASIKIGGLSTTRSYTIGNSTTSIAGTDLDIQAGSSLVFGSAGAGTSLQTLALAANNTAVIAGTLDIGNNVGNTAVFTIGTAGNASVANGGRYKHGITSGTVPIFVWNTGSTCEYTGLVGSAPGSSGNQTYYNLIWNCPGITGPLGLAGNILTINGDFTVASTGTGSIRLNSSASTTTNVAGKLIISGGFLSLNSATGGAVILNVGGDCNISAGTLTPNMSNNTAAPTININGDLNLSGGTLDMHQSGNTANNGIVNLKGNFNMTGGALAKTGTAAGATFNFAKTGTQTFTKSAGTISGNITFNINSGATVDFGTNVLDGTGPLFTLSSGGGIITANSAGITSSGATGTIQTTGTRTFSTGANYTYNSSAANQSTGSGLPATVNTLTINNTFGGTGVTLTNSVSASTLTLTAGKLVTGANTVTVSTTGGLTTGGSTNYVNGTLIRAVAAGASSSINFPVGDASNYAPVSLDFSAGNAAGNVTASTSVPGVPPAVGSLISQTNYINRNWTLAFSASPVYSALFTYKNPGDVVGTPDLNNLRIGKLTSGVWSNPAGASGSPSVLTPTLNSGGTFSFGDVAYSIVSSAGANGSISPNGTTLVNSGGSQAYTITPAACYSVSDVLVDGVSVGAVTSYTFSNVTADHTISASFVINTYNITVTQAANGTIAPGSGPVNCGSNATYTITPDACYSIADVVVDGSSVGAVTSYTFTNVTAPHTITASYTFNTYNITVTQGANGTIAPGTGSVNCGSNATYTITPDACYSVADVVVDGSSVGAVTSYTFSNVTAAHTITASYSLNTYNITVTQTANGTIAPGSGSVNCGSNATYTITPDACYSIADVVVDGSSVGVVTSYTFTNVTATHTITATYSINTYTITVTSGANGSVTPGTGSVNCGDNATYTVTPDPGYLVSDVTVDGTPATALTTGSYATGGTYVFSNVTAAHSISVTFVLNCVNVSITNVTASNPGPLCSGQTTNLTANGVAGTNAVVTWYTGPGGTGVNLGTGTTLNNVGANTYYARVTGDCGTPAEASITINSVGNTFSGTGNWSDNARWSCGAPPSSGDAVTIAAGANATLDVNFTVSGSLTMNATSTLTVNPTRTLSVDVAATANFNGQSVTFKSDNTGTASLGQVNGTLSGATNVTVERYIRNNGFRSWRLLSVPVTSTQTIRQAWQEGDANPLPKQNNVAGYGTQITGVFTTQAAAAAAGFDSTSVQAGMLRWNGSAWSNITSTNQSINNFNSYFLYIRGDRSLTVTGATSSSSSTTLRTKGTVYTGDQVTNIGANAFALIPNLYPSAISFTGLTRTGGVSNLFYIWDSKKLNGQSLGAYQTFSGTNGFLCLLSGGSYTLGQPNTTIESGQSFFVQSTTAGTLTLKESAKISGTNGSLGFRPSGPLSKIDTRLLNSNSEMIDANAVVFNAAYTKAVAEEDAPKLGNPGVNLAIESESKLLAVEGTAPVKDGDVIQYRMWNLDKGNYQLEIVAQNMAAGTEATLEDSYLKTATPVNMSSNTTVSFTVDQNTGSSAANRFRLVFGKVRATAQTEATFTVAPNPIENGTMNIVFRNQKAGRYSVRLLSVDGRTVLTKTVSHAGGNANQSINLPASITSGTYTVEIISAGNSRSTQTVLVSRK